MTYINFLFEGHDKEKYTINAEEVFAPYLILILDNYGRLYFGYIVNKELTELPLKKDNKKINLKGTLKISIKSENSSNNQQQNDFNVLNDKSLKPGKIFERKEIKQENNNIINKNLNFEENNISPLYKNFLNNIDKKNEGIENNIIKNLNLQDNNPGENINKNKLNEEQIQIKIKKGNNDVIEKSNDLININQFECHSNYKTFLDKFQKNQENKLNIETFSESDSEYVPIKSLNIINKQCEKVYKNDKIEDFKTHSIKENIGIDSQWYKEEIEKYKSQKARLLELREEEKKILLDKFEKDSKELKEETKKIIEDRLAQNEKQISELKKISLKLVEMEEIKAKKNLEDAEKNREDKIILINDLKEKMFNESKKNFACNLEIYLEVIKNKVNYFVQQTEKLNIIQDNIKQSTNLFHNIELEIEKFNLFKKEVKDKINSYHQIDYNSNIEYLNERFNNLIEIIIKKEKNFLNEEIEEFILNNQLNLSEGNKNKVLEIKKRYEKLIGYFKQKILKFKEQYDQINKLIEKFSNNQNINNLLELNNKYEGSFNKFVQIYPQDLQVNCFNKKSQTNIRTLNFNFNKKKFKFTRESENSNLQKNSISNYDETAHTKIFEEIMKEYEFEYNNLKDKFENNKKEFNNLKNLEGKKNYINKEISISGQLNFNFNKNVCSETAIKNLYKNHKYNNLCSQDPFNNIDLFNELKKNISKVLQNHIPIVEYLDDSGDDFDDIFNKNKDVSTNNFCDYNPIANSQDFQLYKESEFVNIFSYKDLNDLYIKYRDDFNLEKIIENGEKKSKEENEKNKSFTSFTSKKQDKVEDENREVIKKPKEKLNSSLNYINKNSQLPENLIVQIKNSDSTNMNFSKNNNLSDEVKKEQKVNALLYEKNKMQNTVKAENDISKLKDKNDSIFNYKEVPNKNENSLSKSPIDNYDKANVKNKVKLEIDKDYSKNEIEKGKSVEKDSINSNFINNFNQNAPLFTKNQIEGVSKIELKPPVSNNSPFPLENTIFKKNENFTEINKLSNLDKNVIKNSKTCIEAEKPKSEVLKNKENVSSNCNPFLMKSSLEQNIAFSNMDVNNQMPSNTTGIISLEDKDKTFKAEELKSKEANNYNISKTQEVKDSQNQIENSTINLLNKNLSFGKSVEIQENKQQLDSKKMVETDKLYESIHQNAQNLEKDNKNQQIDNLGESKTSSFNFCEKTQAINQPFNTSQKSIFSGLEKPQMVCTTINNSITSFQNTGIFGIPGKNSFSQLNMNQQQEHITSLIENSKPEASTIPKTGFGQTSSLGTSLISKVYFNNFIFIFIK